MISVLAHCQGLWIVSGHNLSFFLQFFVQKTLQRKPDYDPPELELALKGLISVYVIYLFSPKQGFLYHNLSNLVYRNDYISHNTYVDW